MNALDQTRRSVLDLYKYVVHEYNREKEFNTDLPSSVAVQAYLRGSMTAYKIVLKNIRYYRKRDTVQTVLAGHWLASQ